MIEGYSLLSSCSRLAIRRKGSRAGELVELECYGETSWKTKRQGPAGPRASNRLSEYAMSAPFLLKAETVERLLKCPTQLSGIHAEVTIR
jgi:hypothetical protein